MRQLPVGQTERNYEIKGLYLIELNCFKKEESGRKPDLLSGGGMLAHDLRTVKVLKGHEGILSI